LDLPSNQVLAFFNKTVRKIVSHMRGLVEANVAKELPSDATLKSMSHRAGEMHALKSTLRTDQQEDERRFFAATSSSSSSSSIPSTVSLPKGPKPAASEPEAAGAGEHGKQQHKKHKKHKRDGADHHHRQGGGGGEGHSKKSKHSHSN